MIPTALGNMIGGGLFIAVPYWYLYLTGEVGVNINFNLGSLATAEEAGGPMRRDKQVDGQGGSNGTIEGQDPYAAPPELPSSGSQITSAIGRELSDDSPYTKTHAERVKSENGIPGDEKV